MEQQAAQDFISNGRMGDADLSELAAACDRIIRATVQKSNRSAASLAGSFVRHARDKGGVLLQTALRSQAWVRHVGGDYRGAEKAYLEARQLVRGRDPLIRARIDRILIDVYMYLGDFDEAHRRGRLATATFRRMGRDADVVMTRVNLANVYHRQDRHRDARRLYQEATAFFEARGNDAAIARCYYNLANTQVQLFEFGDAGRLYEEARRKFAGLGWELYANEARYGRAWLSLLEGAYHIALNELAECECIYRQSGQPRGVVLCQLDRAEAFLALNLFSDAAEIASEAEKQARVLGIRYERAKAAFFYGYACFGLKRLRLGKAAFTRAIEHFADGKNRAFEAVVRFATAQHSRADVRRRLLNDARRNLVRMQLPLWEAICDLQIAADGYADRPVFARLHRNPAVTSVPHLYALYQTILGDRAAVGDRTEQAEEHWLRAVEVLDSIRAKLPPVELRSTFLRKRQDPYLRLVESHVENDPARAAGFSERYHTAGLWSPVHDVEGGDTARKKARSSLEALAGQVMVLSREIDDRFGKRTSAALRRKPEFARLQREARRRLARLDTLASAPPASERLNEAFENTAARLPIVQFHLSTEDLIVFVHDGHGTRSHVYPGGRQLLARFAAQWRFQVGRHEWRYGSAVRDVSSEQDELLLEIGDWLWSPLEIPSSARRVLVLPEGPAYDLPWPAIRCGREFLVDRHDVVLAPSLRHYIHASGHKTRSHRVAVFIGDRRGLENVGAEVATIRERASTGVTVYDPCRRQDWPARGSARVWHFSGHGFLRSDNPFYSSLLLADGPLFAADLRLLSNRVGLVTLAACKTGQHTTLPGEEATGFVRSFLEMGARNVIASHWAVADRSASRWMQQFYEKFFDGAEPLAALRHAVLSIREEFPSAYHWAAFSLYGAG